MGSIFMDKKKFTIAEKMKAVEAHIHEGAGCRCQESFTPYLLSIDFFATLCPIPPWPLDKSWSVCAALDYVQLCRHPADFSIPSRNLGKGSGESKPIGRQRVLYPFCILCGRYVVGYDAASAFEARRKHGFLCECAESCVG